MAAAAYIPKHVCFTSYVRGSAVNVQCIAASEKQCKAEKTSTIY